MTAKPNSKSKSKSKIKDFELDEEFQSKYPEFSRIYTMGKNLVLEHFKAGLIISKYYSDDITKTINTLRESFLEDSRISIEFTDDKANEFLKDFAQLLGRRLLQDDQEEKNEEQQEGEDQQQKHRMREEVKALKLLHQDITFEEWLPMLQQKHQVLYDTVQENMPDIWIGLDFVLSILRILNLDDCTLPFIGLLLGRPGSGKTMILTLLRDWIYSYFKDSFTPRAFESHTTAVNSREELTKIDMLPQMKDNIFLTPELAPLFSKKEDELIELIGIIIRLADGQGFSSHSGAHGGREYRDTMFTWAGVAVDIPNKVYKILSTLGPKWYHTRLPFKEKTEDELVLEATKGKDHSVKERAIKDALFDYLKWFEIAPHSTMKTESERESENKTDQDLLRVKIQWDRERDDHQAHVLIVKVAMLLTHLRCAVITWESYRSGEEINYEASICEDPSRTRQVLYNLARGHALQTGRNYITLEDVPIVVKTVLSTAHIDRVSAFSLLISMPNGKLTTAQIMEFLNKSKHSAIKTMTEFKAIGLADMYDIQIDGINEDTGIPYKTHSKQIALKEEFKWFLEEEFDKLRQGFVATDNRAYMNLDKKEKAKEDESEESEKSKEGGARVQNRGGTLTFLNFWSIYEQLERGNGGTGTVEHKELHKALIESGHFYQGDATQIIMDMVEAGRLEVVSFETYKRSNSNSD
jgi:hypothetical protein